MNDLATSVTDPNSVSGQLVQSHERIDNLMDCVNTLFKRIDPLLKPSDPGVDPPATQQLTVCSVAHSLRNLNEKIADLTRQTETICQRLNL